MRWTIRNQILIPLIIIQTIAVCIATATTATISMRQSERQVIDRLNSVIETLGHANFPYTGNVLAKMTGLSGAEFVAYANDGRVIGTSFSNLKDAPPTLRSVPLTLRVDSLSNSPIVQLDGDRYFAVLLSSPNGSRDSSLLVLYPEISWRQTRREASAPSLILGACSLLLMVIVTGWIAHRISRRLGTLNHEVARIASGDFEVFEPGRGQDEVSDLAQSINRMCVQLSKMSITIQQTERTKLLAQIAAGLAHQLRNSLTGARMSVQLHAKRFPPPGGDQSLNVALRQLAMTEEQVKGLLSLGRTEKRPVAVCDLNRLVADVTLLVNPACEHAKVILQKYSYSQTIEVVADEAGIRAAVLNLVLNAIEAAGQGGFVRIEAFADFETSSIEVSDSGPGPLPRIAESLFEPFTTSKPEGVGLGLALAQKVAADHGGELTWDRLEQKTRFRLSLPRIPLASKEAV